MWTVEKIMAYALGEHDPGRVTSKWENIKRNVKAEESEKIQSAKKRQLSLEVKI